VAKKTTKRDVILSDARIRLENAKTNLAEQQRLLLAAELVVQAHQESYDALERSLAATPSLLTYFGCAQTVTASGIDGSLITVCVKPQQQERWNR